MIPGSGRSAGEGLGYALQYSWASLVAQLVKNPPTMQETLVGFLGWEDPLEIGTTTYSSILAWRIPWMNVTEQLSLFTSFSMPVSKSIHVGANGIISFLLKKLILKQISEQITSDHLYKNSLNVV